MKKSILLPLALLVILLVVYLLIAQGEKRELTAEVTDNFLAVDSGAVNHIKVIKLGSVLEFVKRSDGWYLPEESRDYRAAPGAVEEIERLASGMQVGEIISSNPDKQMLFQVDTLLGTRVEFYRDDQSLADVIIGKAGANFQNTYVRKPSSDDVYNAIGGLSYLFNRPPSSFKDKTLLQLDLSQINAIEFKGRETDYTLLSQDTLWKVLPHNAESFMGDPQKVSRLVNQFANLKFNDFISDPDSLQLDFTNPEFEVTIGLRDGNDRKLSFVAEGGESRNFYVMSSTADEPYLVYDYVINNLAKKPADLRTEGN